MAPDSNFSSGTVTLGQMRPGQKGRIQSISDSDRDMEERLREIGFDEDLDVAVLHQAPIGKDPISVELDQMTVAVRRAEAAGIEVILDEAAS